MNWQTKAAASSFADRIASSPCARLRQRNLAVRHQTRGSPTWCVIEPIAATCLPG